MLRTRLRTSVCLTLVGIACSPSGGDDELSDESGPDTDGEASDSDTSSDPDTTGETSTGAPDCTNEGMPSEGAALLEWLGELGYASWPAESGPHASTGPHFGSVRTFVNPCLQESLDAGASTHPVGAVAVKQLYGDGDVVEGYSVMIKVAAGEGGDTWYWFEQYQGTTYADAVGSGLCTGCHGGPGNRDYFSSPWPLQ